MQLHIITTKRFFISANLIFIPLVLGILLVVLSLLNCVSGLWHGIALGIVGAIVNGILVYGASKRDRTAILAWIILAILGQRQL